nr:MAG TPA: minor tail protein [Caudoviricetes sp.]
MADGEVIFSTELDNKALYRDLNKAVKDIDRLDGKISKLGAQKIPLEEKLQRITGELDEAKVALADMRAAPKGTYEKVDIADQATRVRLLQAEFTKTANSVDNIGNQLRAAETDLDGAKKKAGEVSDRIREAEANTDGFGDAVAGANDRMKKLLDRVEKLAKRVFIFSMITAALRSVRTWLVEIVKSDQEASAAMAQLKGALLTLAQPLVQVLVPAFTLLARVIAAVVTQIARLVAAISGKSLSSAAASAKALNAQTKALKGTGKAAKDAGKSLASFDEINQLSSSSSSGGGGGASADAIAPDFSFMDEVDARLRKIADAVILIGGGLAAWKLSSLLPGTLGTVAEKLAGIALTVGGLILLWDGLSDAWNNGVDWANLIEILGGAATAALGLYLTFGKLGAGIGLIVAGAAMVVTAFRDIDQNGLNLKNTLLMIAGIVSTGLGFWFLTGNVFPLVVAGIAAILFAITTLAGNGEQLIGNLKQTFSGLVTFLDGLINLDIDKMLSGLKGMVSGALNTVLTIVGSVINLIIRGLNWLIEKINSISFDMPDWVPGVGGKSWGPNIPLVKEWQIPQLAQGAVIPPNREFLAVLGDQRSGTNIETPLATMVQAFKQALAESGYSGSSEAVLVLDRDVLGRVVYQLNKAEGNRIGVSLTGV